MLCSLIPWGDVDERSIEDVTPDDLRPYTQCHFFAGIGVWSLALQRAGWPDDRPVWTGSCPCQPFSAAGKGNGFADERHLWPAWFHLITQCKPPIVLGEQVASKDGLGWLDLVSSDMEGAGYAVGASDLCAAGFGGAHIRQRLYFVGVADAEGTGGRQNIRAIRGSEGPGLRNAERQNSRRPGIGTRRISHSNPTGGLDHHHHHQGSQGHAGDGGEASGREGPERPVAEASVSGGMALPNSRERERLANGEGRERDGETTEWNESDCSVESGSPTSRLADAPSAGPFPGAQPRIHSGEESRRAWNGEPERPGSVSGSAHAPMLGRNAADWLYCRDGKWRPVEPGTFPLAHAAPARVGRLRAYGNGLDLETATGFVEAVMECAP